MTDQLDIYDPEPNELTSDDVHQFLLERRAANDERPEIQQLWQSFDYHTAQEEFDLGRRTYSEMRRRFLAALIAMP
jgi:hypothetical protein